MSKKKQKPKTKDERVMDAIPTNWLDTLLTGRDGIGKPPDDCTHIEKLMRGVAAAVREALKTPRKR